MHRAYAHGYRDALAKFAGAMNPEMTKHLWELGGLGLLALPVAHHAATADNTKDKALAGTELAGLTALSVPTISSLSKHLLHR